MISEEATTKIYRKLPTTEELRWEIININEIAGVYNIPMEIQERMWEKAKKESPKIFDRRKAKVESCSHLQKNM